MNIDAKMAIKIQELKEEVTELFQDSTRTDADLVHTLKALQGVIPLIEDIKTEVAYLVRNEYLMRKPDEKDEEDDNPETDPTQPTYTPGEDDPPIDQVMEEVLEKVKQLEYYKKLIEEKKQNLPSLRRWTDPLLFALQQAIDFTYKWKKLNDEREERFLRRVDQLDGDSTSKLKHATDEVIAALEDLAETIPVLAEDVKDLINGVNIKIGEDDATIFEKLREIFDLDNSTDGKVDDIKADTTDIKDGIDTMSDDMGTCCTNLNNKADQNLSKSDAIKRDTESIKDDVSKLQPSTQSNQTLAIVQKINATMASLEAIRGLL